MTRYDAILPASDVKLIREAIDLSLSVAGATDALAVRVLEFSDKDIADLKRIRARFLEIEEGL